MRLASRLSQVNSIRRDRPLTFDERVYDVTNSLTVRSQHVAYTQRCPTGNLTS